LLRRQEAREVPAGSQNDGRVDTGPPIIDRKKAWGVYYWTASIDSTPGKSKPFGIVLLLCVLSGKHAVKTCASRPHDSTLFAESLEVLLPACTTRIVCSARATFPCT